MQDDLHETLLYAETRRLFESIRQPGTGQISDAGEIHSAPDGRSAVFSGVLVDRLEGTPPTRICSVDFATGDTRILTLGPNIDRSPKYSPGGGQIAFLSDRRNTGNFQLYLLDLRSGAARGTPAVSGWIEYSHWSPDGTKILIGVAGHGADVAGTQGAVSSKPAAGASSSWIPSVESGGEAYRWRSVWLYDCQLDSVRQVSQTQRNVWEAAWCGDRAIAAVISPGPDEGHWYTAQLHILDTHTGQERHIYKPQYQIGWLSASPSGKHLAFVEGVCSDRWVVAGELCVIDTHSGAKCRINTHDVDVTHTEWCSEGRLLFAGLRGFETVIGIYDLISDSVRELWASDSITTGRGLSKGGFCITASATSEAGDCVLIGESFWRAPEISLVSGGEYRTVRSFGLLATTEDRSSAVHRITWHASDGRDIQGWLLTPDGARPHPVVMNVHGGPVAHWRPTWLGRAPSMLVWMLVRHGYAVFLPNPRGSSGRGLDFAKQVVGDMGGEDSRDLLSGLDHLVRCGFADTQRLGVMGVSYGGFMTSWLVTQDSRFAAAVSVAPVTNAVSEHLLSNIPHFVKMFLADTYTRPGGRYFERSPVIHAHKATTPTLNICGALDRCTPAAEAIQFHNALRESGVKSTLVIYPEEGHGIRAFPAVIDYVARVVQWFSEHMCAGIKPAEDQG